MPRDSVIVYERIKEGLCPICGLKPTGNETLVVDAKFGSVLVCGRHIVQGTDKITE